MPADEPIRLDKLVSTDGDDDRWSRRGQPTAYLGLDPAVAVAELARHLEVDPRDDPVRRRLLGVDLAVDGLLDVRDEAARVAIGGPPGVHALRDREVARGIGDRARALDGCTGLLVPSMAFLDDPARGNLVLFVERLGGDMAALVHGQHEGGLVDVRPGAARR